MHDNLELLKGRNPLLLLASKGNAQFDAISFVFFIFHLKAVRLISIETMSSLRVILFLVWQRFLCLKDTGQHFRLL